jgi:GT2 family glycosyltransferase
VQTDPPRLTFAVIIPVYNAENTIGAAVDSALAQTRPADEILVCNDGSTDRTGEVLATYGERITVIDQPNAGVSAACNAMLSATRSDFVIKLDADDTWLPERIRRIEQHLMANPHLDIVTTDAWVVEHGSPVRTVYEGWGFPEEHQEVEILRDDFIYSSAAVRRASLLAVGGWDATRSHQCEYDGWVRMILAGSRAGLVASPLATYRLHPGSLSTRLRETWTSDLELLDAVVAAEKLTQKQIGAAREHRNLLVRRLRMLEAKQALQNREPGVRRKCILVSLAPGEIMRRRVKFVAAAVAPGFAGRRLRG